MKMEEKIMKTERKEEIDFLEETLRVQFPQSYRKFLLDKGSAVIDGYKILGIPTKDIPTSVLEATGILREQRKDLPENFVAVCLKGDKAMCLDLGKAAEDDAPVVQVNLAEKGSKPMALRQKYFSEWLDFHQKVSHSHLNQFGFLIVDGKYPS